MHLEFSFTMLNYCIDTNFVKQSWCRGKAQSNSAVKEYKFTRSCEASEIGDLETQTTSDVNYCYCFYYIHFINLES